MHSFNMLSAVLAASVLTLSAATTLPSLNRACVLDDNGEPICARLDEGRESAAEISPLVRMGSCADNDAACWNLKAIAITNEIRRRKGDGTALQSGPQVMLDNAVRWSRHQMSTRMQHQSPLPTLACGVRVNRENVAMFGGMDVDPAVQCMKQWENSAGHLRNIVQASAGDYVCVGIVKRGTTVYCTQTFSSPSSGSGSCQSLGGGSGARQPSPATTTTRPPATQAARRTAASNPGGGGSGGQSTGANTSAATNTQTGRFCTWFLRSDYVNQPRYNWIVNRCRAYLNGQ